MQHAHATIYVPHISNLDLVGLLASSEAGYPLPMKRYRTRHKKPPSDVPWATQSYERAWRSYIQGNVVSEYSARLIQTFLTIMGGTGKLQHDDEEGGGERLHRKDLGNPGQRLSVAEVHQAMVGEKRRTAAMDASSSTITKRIHSAMTLVQRLVAKNNAARTTLVDVDTRASRYHRVNSSTRESSHGNATPFPAGSQQVKVEMYRRNWMTAHATWRRRLAEAKDKDGESVAPYAEQWRLMELVHRRCVLEAKEEQKGRINRTAQEPERVFGHGLPGSGKTQVMKWLSEYFQEVWGWRHGTQFVFLAPLNSMAARINGYTVHSWAEVQWDKNGPKGSTHMQTGNKDSQDMSSMAAKMELCRWLFVDEVEAVGAEIIGVMDQNTSDAARRRLYKFRGDTQDPLDQRCFGGLNLCFFGDLWQLPPVLQVSVSSNPFRLKANTSHQARKAMNFFWGQDSLNGFTQRPFEFAVCKRIKDTWYSKVVDECRDGAMCDDTFNFLHGYATSACGSSVLGQSSSCDCQVVPEESVTASGSAKGSVPAESMTACRPQFVFFLLVRSPSSSFLSSVNLALCSHGRHPGALKYGARARWSRSIV